MRSFVSATSGTRGWVHAAGRLTVALVAVLATLFAATSLAHADWSGDGKTDILAVDSAGDLHMFRGDGAGGWIVGTGEWVGNGWDQAPSIVQPGDWDGDGNLDVLAVKRDGNLYLYRGNGAGGWITGHAERIGSQWDMYHRILAPGDWDGDDNPDLLAVRLDGNMYLYRGNGVGGFITGNPEWIGDGFDVALSLVTAGDWNGDSAPDLLAVKSDGELYMYRGNGTGGWITGNGERVGSGWFFPQIAAPGDFSGDGLPDLLAVDSLGQLVMFRGNGTGGWLLGYGEVVGNSGWSPLRILSGPPLEEDGFAPVAGPLYDQAWRDPDTRNAVVDLYAGENSASGSGLLSSSSFETFAGERATLSAGAGCVTNAWARRTKRSATRIHVMYRFRMNINFCFSGTQVTSTNVWIEWEDESAFSDVEGIVGKTTRWFTALGNSRGGRTFYRKGKVSNCVLKYGCVGTTYPWIRARLLGNGRWTWEGGN